MMKKYLPILRLILHGCATGLCFVDYTLLTLWKAPYWAQWVTALLSYVTTILYVVWLIKSENIKLIYMLAMVSMISTIFMFICFSAYLIAVLHFLLCGALDYLMILYKKKKSILVYVDNSESCVYMKRNVVIERTVVLHMGEFVQMVKNEDENSYESDDQIKVRKFNGEEFFVNKSDVVENVEEVLGEL